MSKNKKMHIGGVSAHQLAKKYGTPLYVYEAEKIRERFNDFKNNISYKKLKIHYAVKANNNVEILKLLRRAGSNAETVSIGAIKLAFKAGFKPSQIIHTCNGMTDDEIKFLIKNKITTNIDSLTQLEKWGKFNPRSSVSIRLNQDIGAGSHRYLVTGGEDSKFGIHISHLDEAVNLIKKYRLKVTGLQQHIGTDAFLEPSLFIRAAKALMERAHKFDGLEFLDFGGAFGIPYRPGEEPLDPKALGKEFVPVIEDFNKSYGRKITVILEPGRYLVAESGTLLAKVTDVKRNTSRTFVSIDTGMNHLIRPALYNAYHEIINADGGTKKDIVSITGNICESADFFAKNRKLPEFKVGDLAAILDTGAYGYSMSSNYNSRPRPAEVLIDNGKARLIRKRERL